MFNGAGDPNAVAEKVMGKLQPFLNRLGKGQGAQTLMSNLLFPQTHGMGWDIKKVQMFRTLINPIGRARIRDARADGC
jgi:hypothetical protein